MDRDEQAELPFAQQVEQILGRFLTGSERLTGGLWQPSLPPSLAHLESALERERDVLRAQIPEGTVTVLAVGGGGAFTDRLLADGFEVDVMVPDEASARRVTERLPAVGHVYTRRFEALVPRRPYDLVLFRGSFRSIDPDMGVARIEACTSPGSHVLMYDTFRNGSPGAAPPLQAHRWSDVEQALAGQPLDSVTELDLTDEAAPAWDLLGRFMDEVAAPLRDLTATHMTREHPWAQRLLGRSLRRELGALERRYLHGGTSARSYREHFTCRLLVWRRTGD